jgi:histidinol-phosphate/aromatic aminotransferase/cobyric acid decarboxylase-like protein
MLNHEKMKPYQFGESRGISLHLNEFNRDHHPDVLVQINSKNIYSYNTDIKLHNDLVDKICEYACVNKENLVITNGADEALKLIIDNYSFNNTYVIKPAYIQYERFTIANNKKVIHTNTLMEKYPEHSIVCVCTPNNPDGAVYSKELLVSTITSNPKVVFIIDRTYSDYRILQGHPDEMADLVVNKNVFIVRSFSKAFGMAGIRLGYIMTCSENAENLNAIFNYKNVTHLSKQIGLNILTHKEHYSKLAKQMFEIKKDLLTKLVDYDTIDTDCNFIVVRFCNMYELDSFVKLCYYNGFAVRNIHKYMKNCARISIGSEYQMKNFISML